MKMKSLIASAAIAVTLPFSVFSQTSTSLDKDEHLLDGNNFTVQYQNASAIDISFENGEITYKWIAGRNAAEPAKTLSYTSKKVAPETYFVSWHERDTQTYVTMVYNFAANVGSVSVIARYGSEKPFTGFQAGVIEHFGSL